MCYKEAGLKFGRVFGFRHHCLVTMSNHRYICIVILCLKVEQKQVCEQSLYVETI